MQGRLKRVEYNEDVFIDAGMVQGIEVSLFNEQQQREEKVTYYFETLTYFCCRPKNGPTMHYMKPAWKTLM